MDTLDQRVSKYGIIFLINTLITTPTRNRLKYQACLLNSKFISTEILASAIKMNRQASIKHWHLLDWRNAYPSGCCRLSWAICTKKRRLREMNNFWIRIKKTSKDWWPSCCQHAPPIKKQHTNKHTLVKNNTYKKKNTHINLFISMCYIFNTQVSYRGLKYGRFAAKFPSAFR